MVYKLKFLISPIVVYSELNKEHDSKLAVNKTYLLKKFLTALGCSIVSNILILEFIEPLINNADKMSFIAVFFKLIPYTFYIHVILYYMVFENVISSLSEITQIKNRVFYEDWWNADTLHEYLKKWCILMNSFTVKYFPNFGKRVTLTLQVSLLLILLFEVFARGVNV